MGGEGRRVGAVATPIAATAASGVACLVSAPPGRCVVRPATQTAALLLLWRTLHILKPSSAHADLYEVPQHPRWVLA